MRSASLLIALAALSSCGSASSHYSDAKVGSFAGRIVLEWEGPDAFIYTPDPERPFRFTRHDGKVIQPEAMFTDGGSVPRVLWVFKNYSPWGYGPAFIVHDWLFDAHGCGTPGYDDYTVDEAAMVMSECIKTLMETREDIPISELTMYSMYLAVMTQAARDAWDNNSCFQPVPEDEGHMARVFGLEGEGHVARLLALEGEGDAEAEDIGGDEAEADRLKAKRRVILGRHTQEYDFDK